MSLADIGLSVSGNQVILVMPTLTPVDVFNIEASHIGLKHFDYDGSRTYPWQVAKDLDA
jgi:hypothetical protein